jgi:hypothetical protein
LTAPVVKVIAGAGKLRGHRVGGGTDPS